MSGKNISRRRFVQTAASSAVVLSAGPSLGVLGANERLRVGLIGAGGRGSRHYRLFLENHKDAEIVAVSDLDPVRLDKAVRDIKTARPFQDFREIIDKKDIDAVFVCTPGHWHMIPTIMAMQAGKDVYVEKPAGHTIHEGRLLVEAAKKYNRVIQIGTQQRSGPHWINTRKRIQAGEIGQVTNVNVWNYWPVNARISGQLGKPDCDPPSGVNYDMWLGPAPKRPFNPSRWHYNFYFFFDYSGGMMQAWAIHHFDIVLWTMGHNIKSVSTVGNKYVLKDDRETPDTADAVFDCGDYTMYYALRHANRWIQPGRRNHAIEFIGTKGVLQISRSGFDMYHENDKPGTKPYYTEQPAGLPDYHGYNTAMHERNFLDCVRSRKTTRSDALSGHVGALPGHLANISYRVGRGIKWDADTETIPGDPEAAGLLTKHYREPWHLPKV
ncbi:MAG: Gfo/Idh/MocA family oxidoreductase [Planctomycetota bacterium]|nr:MAG: Gfo/Idh/MocA family oxidoreductase [Planctomycetota bacterium]